MRHPVVCCNQKGGVGVRQKHNYVVVAKREGFAVESELWLRRISAHDRLDY